MPLSIQQLESVVMRLRRKEADPDYVEPNYVGITVMGLNADDNIKMFQDGVEINANGATISEVYEATKEALRSGV